MIYLELCRSILELKNFIPTERFLQILNNELDKATTNVNKRQQAYELFSNLTEDNLEETAIIMEKLDNVN